MVDTAALKVYIRDAVGRRTSTLLSAAGLGVLFRIVVLTDTNQESPVYSDDFSLGRNDRHALYNIDQAMLYKSVI